MADFWTSRIGGPFGLRKAVDLNLLAARLPGILTAPCVVRIFAENLLRNSPDGVDAVARLLKREGDVVFTPHRVVMQDASGLPALLDIAGLRDCAAEKGLPPQHIDLGCPTHLVIDHSIRAAATGPGAELRNLDLEYRENEERFQFLRWAAQAFRNLTVIPPGNGIVHQINLEQLAEVVADRDGWIYPDTVVGTDSHTPMINGLGVLGWGVGGIEATSVLLGQPLTLPPPSVVGVRLLNGIEPGTQMMDVALRLAERLRKENVVGAFLEFFGPGAKSLGVPDRATLSNMTPEYGATCSLFPVDEVTLGYLRATGRAAQAELALHYPGHRLFARNTDQERTFDRVIDFDLAAVRATVAGPSLPHQARSLPEVAALAATPVPAAPATALSDGDIVIAAITSCTNTSNPAAMVAAGLLARNALRLGLRVGDRIKASLSPGSLAVSRYLEGLGLLAPLEEIGFARAGYGCMTCVGNSGDLDEEISKAISDRDLDVAAVLSGNRNFEGRVHPQVRSNFLASPPLVVAYALAGSVRIDLQSGPIARAGERSVFLRDVWPAPDEVERMVGAIASHVSGQGYLDYERWSALAAVEGSRFPWSAESTYLVRPEIRLPEPRRETLPEARALLLLGDAITTDHISPVGRITPDSPAGHYLKSLGVAPSEFNTYGGRRGNAVVMRHGTFANPRLRNRLAGGRDGWFTRHLPTGDVVPIVEAAERYSRCGTPLVIVAGDNYGTGSARDWAAKGTDALGVRAVLARSFERIHRANLALVGVLPLEWQDRPPLDGSETFAISGHPHEVAPGCTLELTLSRDGVVLGAYEVTCRLDTELEVAVWRDGGFLARRFGELVAGNADH